MEGSLEFKHIEDMIHDAEQQAGTDSSDETDDLPF